MTDVPIVLRDVTADEVAFYDENGWVMLRAFVSPELIEKALASGKREMEKRLGNSSAKQGGGGHDGEAYGILDMPVWRDWHWVARDEHIEPFLTLALCKDLGRNAQRLIGRNVPVRNHLDMLGIKMPANTLGSGLLDWHQDWPYYPFDRVGALNFWFPLVEVTPEMGTMRFRSGSHKAGPLGTRISGKSEPGQSLIDHYPGFREKYPISEPFTLRPGDVSVHNTMLVHCGPPNCTDRERWAFICSYFPADVCYTGAPNHIFRPELGLKIGEPITNDFFPQVYP
ncbi:MAG TPA: phytanoyl-CoA dioxygenase family protein [Steroidobacteraceae bacterium]|nr:phytanoyl-CoA dioxygenase family protein [Steroidobacteraceae bacterium]